MVKCRRLLLCLVVLVPALAACGAKAGVGGRPAAATPVTTSVARFSPCLDAARSLDVVLQREYQKDNAPWFSAEASRLKADAAMERNSTLRGEMLQEETFWSDLADNLSGGKAEDESMNDPESMAIKLGNACGYYMVGDTQTAPPPPGI